MIADGLKAKKKQSSASSHEMKLSPAPSKETMARDDNESNEDADEREGAESPHISRVKDEGGIEARGC